MSAAELELVGPLVTLLEQIDATFLCIAARFGAEPRHYSPLLREADLRAVDYYASFPHLVMLPVANAREPENLERFRRSNQAADAGPVQFADLAPVECVLAPAACYPVYPSLRGTHLGQVPRCVTVRSTCFRHETEEQPLRRQRSFQMREIVHVGTAASAREFLRAAEVEALALAKAWDLEVSVVAATDPFFDPASSPKYLHQKLFPTKHELVWGGNLALGSLNYHRGFFGNAYGLEVGGEAAHTACFAIGLERWTYAVHSRGAEVLSG